MRRLPVYVLVETAGGMRGERLESVLNGLQVMVNSLRQDPFALESVYLSLIGFDKQPYLYFPLTGLESVQIPSIQIPQSSAPHMGTALKFVCGRVQKEIIKNDEQTKGDWKPLLFILTRGVPADKADFRESVMEVQKCGFASVTICIAGSSIMSDEMRLLTTNIVSLENADRATIMSFFKWVSASIGVVNQENHSNQELRLPPPPPELLAPL
jgi:uncharacterized protein YegL